MSRTWSWMVLATGCAAELEPVDDTGASAAPRCEEVQRETVSDDERIPGGPAAPLADLLRAVEGSFRGVPDARTPGVELRTRVARGEGPAAVVWSRWSDGPEAGAACPARYAVPMLQQLEVSGAGGATAAGTWLAGDDGTGFVATAPLAEVEGLTPTALVPAEWETVDLALGTAPAADGSLTIAVTWDAERTTDPADAMLAPGVAPADAPTISTATEPLWTATLRRE